MNAVLCYGDDGSDKGEEFDVEGGIKLFTSHIPKKSPSQNLTLEARWSSKKNKSKSLVDKLVIPGPKKATSKVAKVKGHPKKIDSYGEVELNLAMMKKLRTIQKRKTIRKREDFIIEIKDDDMGVTYGYIDCGAFYVSKAKIQWHLGRKHASQLRKLLKMGM